MVAAGDCARLVRAGRAIEAAVAAGELPAHVDAAALVQVILAMLQGFVLQAAWDPSLDARRYAGTCTAVLDAYRAGVSVSVARRPRWRAQR